MTFQQYVHRCHDLNNGSVSVVGDEDLLNGGLYLKGSPAAPFK